MRSDWLPVDLPPGLRIGTSSFAWPEWHGVFYPADLPAGERIAWYAEQFSTVELDASFYRCPTPRQTSSWALKTPESFVFSLKAPRTITHEDGLAESDSQVTEFLEALRPLGPRQGPLLLQFPYFAKGRDEHEYATGERFLADLEPWLERWSTAAQWVVEVRNSTWLSSPLLDLLRSYKTPLALTAYYTMPSLMAVQRQRLDVLTGPFAYVRFLGDHRRLDRLNDELVADGAKPKGYNQLIVDREDEMRGWVDALLPVLTRRAVWVYLNNHYAGFGPGSAKLLARLWDQIHG